MKRIFALFAVLLSAPVFAQTVANGPYYATPAWDQTLPANTRFIVLSNFNNAAVLDRETGLVWERSPSTTPLTWYNALQACLNKSVGGRAGWKLPSIQELRSLVDPTTVNPALPVGNPFTNIQFVTTVESPFYWSSTTISLSGAAWIVFFATGDAFVGTKSSSGSNFAWCVRGGPGVDAQ
jgi:hypothetical protein